MGGVPRQVRVPVSGGDLRDGHHHARGPFFPPRGGPEVTSAAISSP
jgi:hypothetical protein